jgi:hypothetical protein
MSKQYGTTTPNRAAEKALFGTDAFLRRHLRTWISRHRPSDEDEETVYYRMVNYLASLDDEDKGYLLDVGWTAVFDSMVRRLGESAEEEKAQAKQSGEYRAEDFAD